MQDIFWNTENINQGNFPCAVTDFTAAIEIDQQFPDAYKRRGQTRAAM